MRGRSFPLLVHRAGSDGGPPDRHCLGTRGRANGLPRRFEKPGNAPEAKSAIVPPARQLVARQGNRQVQQAVRKGGREGVTSARLPLLPPLTCCSPLRHAPCGLDVLKGVGKVHVAGDAHRDASLEDFGLLPTVGTRRVYDNCGPVQGCPQLPFVSGGVSATDSTVKQKGQPLDVLTGYASAPPVQLPKLYGVSFPGHFPGSSCFLHNLLRPCRTSAWIPACKKQLQAWSEARGG